MQDKISVIVPVYNGETYLAKCLDSLLAQTHTNLEILLINDGSTDATEFLCQQYAAKDARIVYIAQENKGVSVARNKGLNAMTGDYLAFMDADDWLDLDAYEKLLATMSQQAVEVVFFQSTNDTPEGGSQHRCSRAKTGKADGEEMVRQMLCYVDKSGRPYGYYFNVWNKFFKVDALRKVGLQDFAEGVSILEDGIWLMHHIPYLQSGYLTTAAYYHRLIHAQSIMGNKSDAINRELRFASSYAVIAEQVQAMQVEKLSNRCKEAYFSSLERIIEQAKLEKNEEAITSLIQTLSPRYQTEFIAPALCKYYPRISFCRLLRRWSTRIYYIFYDSAYWVYRLVFPRKKK